MPPESLIMSEKLRDYILLCVCLLRFLYLFNQVLGNCLLVIAVFAFTWGYTICTFFSVHTDNR